MSKSKVPDERQAPGNAKVGEAGKRMPYRAPRLRLFGSVAKLTGTKTGSGVDGTMQMTCL